MKFKNSLLVFLLFFSCSTLFLHGAPEDKEESCDSSMEIVRSWRSEATDSSSIEENSDLSLYVNETDDKVELVIKGCGFWKGIAPMGGDDSDEEDSISVEDGKGNVALHIKGRWCRDKGTIHVEAKVLKKYLLEFCEAYSIQLENGDQITGDSYQGLRKFRFSEKKLRRILSFLEHAYALEQSESGDDSKLKLLLKKDGYQLLRHNPKSLKALSGVLKKSLDPNDMRYMYWANRQRLERIGSASIVLLVIMNVLYEVFCCKFRDFDNEPACTTFYYTSILISMFFSHEASRWFIRKNNTDEILG